MTPKAYKQFKKAHKGEIAQAKSDIKAKRDVIKLKKQEIKQAKAELKLYKQKQRTDRLNEQATTSSNTANRVNVKRIKKAPATLFGFLTTPRGGK